MLNIIWFAEHRYSSNPYVFCTLGKYQSLDNNSQLVKRTCSIARLNAGQFLTRKGLNNLIVDMAFVRNRRSP